VIASFFMRKRRVLGWLPMPEGAFYLKYRFYAPTEPVIKLTYRLPDLVAR
jgi:hypothetical protein